MIDNSEFLILAESGNFVRGLPLGHSSKWRGLL